MTPPINYKEGVPRVSELVGYAFPFEGESEQRYLEWLSRNNIKPEDYMKEAQDVGTFVHKCMEDYINGANIDEYNPIYSAHKEEINFGLEWIELYKKDEGREFVSEVYLCDKYDRFQGTTDLILINHNTKSVIVFDFKTYGIAKKRWGLPNTYKKPYDKLKKVGVQLSLYAETFVQKGYTIEGLYAIILHESGLYQEALKVMSAEDINNLVSSFITKDIRLPEEITILINFKTMKIEVQTTIPGEAYSKASIIIEETDYEGKTYEEKINEAIALQKYLISQYKKP